MPAIRPPGRVTEHATHDGVMQAGGVYRAMVRRQMQSAGQEDTPVLR